MDDCCRLVLPYNAVHSIQQTEQISNDPPQMGAKSTTTSNHPSTPSLHQVPETPDNTIHWPNADVMLGHCLRRLANIIPIKTLYGLITIFNHEHIFYLNTS